MNEHDDIKIEADDLEAEDRAEQRVAKLRAELKACQKERQEHLDGWQRSKADYVNLLKRMEEEARSAEQKGKVKAVETLLPAFDALERAKEHVPSEALAKEGGEVVNGFLAVAKQLETAFAALGLEEIGTEGEPFDPVIHEAFAQEAVADAAKDNTVIAVLEKGWRACGTVIRPAKVRVACLR